MTNLFAREPTNDVDHRESTTLGIKSDTKQFVWYAVLALIIGAIGYAPWVLSSYGLLPSEIIPIFILIGGASPTLAAVAVSAKRYGRDGPAYVFSGFRRGKNRLSWILVSAILPFIFFFGAIVLQNFTGTSYNLIQVNYLLLFPLLLQNFLMNMWEEVGWRGFALPTLQEKYGALQSSLPLGIVWALWHWPHFAVLDSQMYSIYGSYPMFFLDTLIATMVYTWLYNSTNGSLIAVTLYHAGVNALGSLLILSGILIPSIYTMAINLIIVAIVILLWGHQRLSPSNQVTFDDIAHSPLNTG